MRKILLSTVNPDENRIAVVSNGLLFDYLSMVPGEEDRKFNIYCGIIHEIESSLEACFVNIGDGKKGFLQFSEIDKACLPDGEGSIAERLKVGMPILVQISKDSRSDKGAFLTTRVKLFGHQLIAQPRDKEANAVRISRHASDAERARLNSERGDLALSPGMSIIVRRQGCGKPVAELNWELTHYLQPLWEMIQQVFAKLDAPTLIYQDANIVNLCIREYLTPNTSELVLDSPETYEEAKETLSVLMPELLERVTLLPEGRSIFDDQLLGQLDALMSRSVKLSSGGEVVIDTTEALVAVDVNSKRSRSQSSTEMTALQTNLEAAAEVTRQLRLRNLAGLIVIDFIDMAEETNRRKLESQLQREFSADRASVNLDRISKFGTLTLSRQNIGRPLHEAHSVICAQCKGTGRLPTVRSFVRSLLDKLRETGVKRGSIKSILVEMPLDPAIYLLNEQRARLSEFEASFNCELIVVPREDLQMPDYNLRVDKQHGKSGKELDSFERKPIKGMEHGSYLNDPKSARRDMPAAITSFKPVREQQPPSPPKQNGSGFGSWLRDLFSNKNPKQQDADKPAKPRRSRSGSRKKPAGKEQPRKAPKAQSEQSGDDARSPKRRRRRSGRRSGNKPAAPQAAQAQDKPAPATSGTSKQAQQQPSATAAHASESAPAEPGRSTPQPPASPGG